MNQLVKPKKGFKFEKWLFGKEIEIPEEWERVTLIEKCESKPKYGANVSAIEKNPELPRYIRITDLNDDGSLRDEEWKSIPEEDAKDYILNENDILFARTGATVGKTFLYQKTHGRCAFAGYLIRFKPEDKKLEPKFLFYWTHSKYYWSWLSSIKTQGVQPNVNAEQYSDMPLLCPPLPEQQKISEIISRVDQLIISTQNVIEQTRLLKRGIMQKLLSKGIGHKKFKKIKWLFGKELEIPDEWNIKKIEEIGEIVSGGTPDSTNKNYWSGEILWAIPTDITKIKSNFIEDTERKITKQGLDNSSAKLLPVGAILITSRATIGECVITLKQISTNQGFQNLICNKNFDNFFIYYLIKYYQNNFLRVSQGTTFLEISKTEIKKILLPVPNSKDEQQKIATILSNIDSQITTQSQYKEKLERLKISLMQKLLTGEVRVKV